LCRNDTSSTKPAATLRKYDIVQKTKRLEAAAGDAYQFCMSANRERPLTRGLVVSLSPNEDNTLRRVASGLAHTYRAHDVDRLVQLGLAERTRSGVGLTALGQQRLDNARASTAA
jgi:hypothetical protein